MVGHYGFGSIKLKAGVFEPELEIAGLRALRAAFPRHPLRIDPNGGWSVSTTRRLMPALSEPGLLEYLEDPVGSLEEMAEVARFATMPLATNMVTIAFGHLPRSVALNAVQVVLSDHHYWGGLRASQQLAAIGRVFGLGISMHSNSHLGISLAAMTHLGVTLPNLSYACDTHYPWQEDEVIEGGKLHIIKGQLAPPAGPGLGSNLTGAPWPACTPIFCTAAFANAMMPARCASTNPVSANKDRAFKPPGWSALGRICPWACSLRPVLL